MFGNAISRFGALLLDCAWFCRFSRRVIPRMKDRVKDDRDYRFHIRFAVAGLSAVVIVRLAAVQSAKYGNGGSV